MARYASSGDATTQSEWRNPGKAFANPWFLPTRFYLGDEAGQVIAGAVRSDAFTYVYVEGEIADEDIALQIGYALHDDAGSLLYWSQHTDVPESQWPKIKPGHIRLRSLLPRRLLNQGTYRLDLMVSLYHREWISEPSNTKASIQLEIQGGLSDSAYWTERRQGIFAPVCEWDSTFTSGVNTEPFEISQQVGIPQ